MASKSSKEAQNAGTPNQTLFVKNLPEKVSKTELKRALYMLFSTYGPVLDIVTGRVGAKGQHMRGQAHIVFRDIQTSTQAMRALQSFDFFGKEMAIVYGKGQSNIIPKLRGTFEPSNVAGTQQAEQPNSIFNVPPAAIPSKPAENGLKPAATNADAGPHGTKRPIEEVEEEEDDNEVEMEEDDASMDEDDED